jgi:glycosyltransferase involved in cell wall biosynthesis
VYISLIITCHNRAHLIDRAIRSCLSQLILRKHIEIIVVDDASTDNSLAIVSEFGPDVRVFVNDRNRGVAYTSNVGLKHARGQYWMRVDADDFLNAQACAVMGGILDENPAVDFVYCDHFRVDEHGTKISKVRLDHVEALYNHGAGVLFRTDLLRKIGGYDNNLRNCEDYDLIVRLMQAGHEGYYLPLPLYRYYIHGGNMTLTPERSAYRRHVEKKHGI